MGALFDPKSPAPHSAGFRGITQPWLSTALPKAVMAEVTQPAPFPLDQNPPSCRKHRGSEENRCQSSSGGDWERGNSNCSSTRMLMLDLDQYHSFTQSISYSRVTFQQSRAMCPVSSQTIQPHQRQGSNAPGNGKHLFSAPPSSPPAHPWL